MLGELNNFTYNSEPKKRKEKDLRFIVPPSHMRLRVNIMYEIH